MLVVEKNIFDAIKHFVTLGLHPGACAKYIIMGDRDGAWKRAHPKMLWEYDPSSHYAQTQGTPLDDVLLFVKLALPYWYFDTHEKFLEWVGHKGLSGADEPTKMVFTLFDPDPRLSVGRNWWTN